MFKCCFWSQTLEFNSSELKKLGFHQGSKYSCILLLLFLLFWEVRYSLLAGNPHYFAGSCLSYSECESTREFFVVQSSLQYMSWDSSCWTREPTPAWVITIGSSSQPAIRPLFLDGPLFKIPSLLVGLFIHKLWKNSPCSILKIDLQSLFIGL